MDVDPQPLKLGATTNNTATPNLNQMVEVSLEERMVSMEKRLRNLEACMHRVVAEVVTMKHKKAMPAIKAMKAMKAPKAKFDKKQYMKDYSKRYRTRPYAKLKKKQHMKDYRIRLKAEGKAAVAEFYDDIAKTNSSRF